MKTILPPVVFGAALALIAWVTPLTVADCMAIGFAALVVLWAGASYNRRTRPLVRGEVVGPTKPVAPLRKAA